MEFVLNIDNILREMCNQNLTSVPPIAITLATVIVLTPGHINIRGKLSIFIYKLQNRGTAVKSNPINHDNIRDTCNNQIYHIKPWTTEKTFPVIRGLFPCTAAI